MVIKYNYNYVNICNSHIYMGVTMCRGLVYRGPSE